MTIKEKDHAFLAQNIKGLMMSLMGKWNAQMEDERAQTEFAEVRPADIRVFAQLRGRNVPLSSIHREMGFSRQAAQQAVDRLVGHGMLQVSPAPGNKRDRIVGITEKGQRWRQIAATQIRSFEAEIARAIGPEETENLRRNLQRLLEKAP